MPIVFSQRPSKIEALITSRCEDLNLSKKQMIQRTGLSVSKAMRRLDQLYEGEWKRAVGLLDKLPAALELPTQVLQDAVQASIDDERKAEDAAWRAQFKPHALIRTANNGRPRQITIAALVNAASHLRVRFNPDTPEEEYLPIAQEALRQRLDMIKFFYAEPEEIWVNITPDHAKRYTAAGEFIANHPQALRLGTTVFTLR